MDLEGRNGTEDALRARIPAVVEHWHAALCEVPVEHPAPVRVQQRLLQLTEQAIAFLLTPAAAPEQAESIGMALAQLGYHEPLALGNSQVVLAQQLMAGLAPRELAHLQPRLGALMGAIAVGHGAWNAQITDSGRLEGGWETVRDELEGDSPYRLLVETMQDGVAIIDAQAALVYVNDSYCRMLRYRRHELIGRPLHTLLDADSQLKLREELARSDRERPLHYELTHLRKDGGELCVLVSGHAWYDDKGGFVGGFAIVTDISGLKQSQAEMQQQNRFWRTVLNAVIHPFYVIDAHDYSVRLSNAAARGDDTNANVPCYAVAIQADEPCQSEDRPCPVRIIRESGEPVQVQHVIPDKEGKARTYEIHGYPVFSETGELTHVVEHVLDITERIEADEALRESEQSFRELAENANDGILIATQEANVVFANRRAADITGYSTDELVKITARDAVAPAEFGALIQRLQTRLAARSTSSQVESLIIRKDGESVPVEISTAKTAWRGQPAIILVLRDISARVESQRALERRTQELEMLCSTSNVLTSTLDYGSVFRRLLDQVARLIPYDSATVMRVEGGRACVEHAAGYEHWVGEELAQQVSSAVLMIDDTPDLKWMMRHEKPFVIPDVKRFPGWIPLPGSRHIRSWAGTPLLVDGKVVAFISLDKVEPDFFTPEHAEILAAFAGQAALALENARLFGEVEAGREGLAVLSRQLLQVQEQERQHIARELHDEIGQELTGLKLILDMCLRTSPPDLERSLGQAQRQVNELLARVRDLSLDLRPAMLDDLGLLPTLLWHFQRYEAQTGVHVAFRHQGLNGRRFPSDLESAAYRIVQEALTNVARHACVEETQVWVWATDDLLGARIEDAGVGLDVPAAPQHPSTGLDGMRERATLLGGRLVIDSSPGSGTCITAELPLDGSAITER
jgi:PAS domain S-box-containing protein